MSRSFKCKLCGKRLSVDSNNDATPLLQHIITSHPEIKIPDSVANETVEDVEEAKRKNQLHIPKNKIGQIKKPVSGDSDKSTGQSIENIPQNSEDNKKMSSSNKTSESKSQKTADSVTKLPSKTNKTNSDTDTVIKDINEDKRMKNKNSTQNASITDSKSRVPQDKVSFKESRVSVDKDHKPLISKSTSRASQDMKSDNKNQTNSSHNSVNKIQGDSKFSLNKGFNEKGHTSKSPKSQDPNKEPSPQESKNSFGKTRIIKPKNPKTPVDSTMSEDNYHTPRSSVELPSKPKESKAAVNKGSKDKNDKPRTSKSKSQTSQELISSNSKNSANKKQSVKSENRKNSSDTFSNTKSKDNHRTPSGSIKLPTKKQQADSMASGDETTSAGSKNNVPKLTKKSNAPLGVQAYDTKYRYSIEKWKPGNGKILCPKCGMRQRPILRTRSDKTFRLLNYVHGLHYPKMSLRVKCILCGDKLIIQKDETTPLLDHIKSSHPDINISKSNLNVMNSKYEEKLLLNETQQGTLKQSGYENKKDEGYKILEAGDWDKPEKNSASNSVRQEINSPEINLKDFISGQPEITCLSSDIKSQNQSKPLTIDQGEVNQLLSTESAQKFIGLQYKQTRESIDQTQKFDGLHFKQLEHELNIPLKVSVMNNGRNPRVVYKRRYKIKGIPLQCPARSTSTVTLYKNSLKRWKPGRGTIFCPKCGANKHPTVKIHTDKISNSPLGAACILTCWPLCFLPCLFPPAATEYLYCSVCNNLLGTYDRKTEVIQPVIEKAEKRPSMQSPKPNNSAKEVSDHAPVSASDGKQNKTPK